GHDRWDVVAPATATATAAAAAFPLLAPVLLPQPGQVVAALDGEEAGGNKAVPRLQELAVGGGLVEGGSQEPRQGRERRRLEPDRSEPPRAAAAAGAPGPRCC
ncbi:unnamed protein product, partial [Ectocarpus sp. 12 AP-2014]